MIEIRHLTKVYGARAAVDDLTVTVRPGRITGFLGRNGAGKSTTMRAILGLDHPTSGDTLVAGCPYRDHRAPLRTVGALLEAGAVHPGRSGADHLRALAATHGIGHGRVKQVTQMVGLDDVAGCRAGSYSLGMSQRLGLAAALLGDPAVLILDEPVNGLDANGIRWLRTSAMRPEPRPARASLRGPAPCTSGGKPATWCRTAPATATLESLRDRSGR